MRVSVRSSSQSEAPDLSTTVRVEDDVSSSPAKCDEKDLLPVGTDKTAPIRVVEEKDLAVHEVEEEDDEKLLTDDAYSLLYTAEFCSRTSTFAWFSILLQGGMLMVTFFDLITIGSDPSKYLFSIGLG
jgi:hypothetical protein